MDYQTFAQRIALESGGVPEMIIAQLLPLCANDFFTDSRCWRRTHRMQTQRRSAPFSGILNEDEYVVRVERMTYPNGELIPAVSRNPATRYPVCYSFGTDGISLHGADDDIPPFVTVELSIAPSVDARSLPDELYPYVRRALTALVLSRVYLTPNREWTNPDMAAVQLKQYEDALVEVKRLGSGNHANVNRECVFSW